MRRRHPYENRYCSKCQQTTRHEVKHQHFECLRCGTEKFAVRPAVKREVNPNLPLSA